MYPITPRAGSLLSAPRNAVIALLVAGLVLWVINLVHARPLFLDEANVVRNLFDRGYAGLFVPLDHEQYAPPLYLALTKLLGELLGYREVVLRLPAFAGGLLAVYALYRAGNYLRLGYWTLLPLALCFTNATVLRYVGEVKPYGLDLGLAALVLALHLRPAARPNRWAWTGLGMLLPWFSLPSVFVLGGVGLVKLLRDVRWLAPIAGWLASFAVLYLTVLRQSVGTDYLDSFHAAYFVRIPASVADWRALGHLGWSVLRLVYGHTAVSLLWGGVVVTYGLVHVRLRHLVLILPLLLAAAASGLHFYSLIDRLLLFALPGVWLATALAARRLYASLRPPLRIVFLVVTLFALTSTGAWRGYYRPVTYSDGRALAALAVRHPYTYDSLAEPVLDYYLRIHPDHGKAHPPAGADAKAYFRLYDVTTAPSVRAMLSADSTRLLRAGCRVSKTELYRAAALRVDCP